MYTILMMSCLMIFKNKNSPLKASISSILLSITLSCMFYYKTSSMFSSSIMIITFSSGMMILFCYCSTLCFQENTTQQQNSKNNWMLILLMGYTIIMTHSNPMCKNPLNEKTLSTICEKYTLIFLMTMVIMSMVCINSSLFNPQKKLMKTY